MINPFDATFLTPTKKYRRLSVLLAIHNTPRISQHRMADLTHLSSSMVNNYIKELHKEGLITITGKTNRTQRYDLTPAGRQELISLLLSYSSEIIQLYTGAKRELAGRLHSMQKQGIQTVILFGAGETAEVVLAAMKTTKLILRGVVDSDPEKQGMAFNGVTVQSPETLADIQADAVLITSFGRQEEIYAYIRNVMGDGIGVFKLSDL
jgi:DNA-binding MarR family transcriptional regulator